MTVEVTRANACVPVGPDSAGVLGAFKRERVTSAFPVITTDHALIHEGIAYTASGVLSVANAKTGSIRLTTPGPLTDTAATVTIDMTNANADLTYEAVRPGAAGNDISVTHVDPAAAGSALSVAASGNEFTISLGTAPDVAASRTIGGVVYTHKTPGVAGNTLGIIMHDPGVETASTSAVLTDADTVTITLARDAGGQIVATQEAVCAALADNIDVEAVVGGVPSTLGTDLATAQEAELKLQNGSDGGAIISTAADVVAVLAATPTVATELAATAQGTGLGVVEAKAKAYLAGGTNNAYVHFKPSAIQSSAAVTVTLYEAATVTGTETALEPRNRKRTSSDDSSVLVRTCPDATLGATTVPLAVALVPAAATGAVKVGGSVNAAEEWVLAPNQDYVLGIANASGSAASIAFDVFWYEEPGA